MRVRNTLKHYELRRGKEVQKVLRPAGHDHVWWEEPSAEGPGVKVTIAQALVAGRREASTKTTVRLTPRFNR